jgi:SAM-dependent methyltransferase
VNTNEANGIEHDKHSIITPQTKLYITHDQKVFYGSEAEALLRKNNDKKYLTKEGVVKVSRKRWEEAQQYEENTWMAGGGLEASDDRNFEHKERFDNYRALPNQLFGAVMELGCGPFTNLRLIIPHISKPQKVTLLDPLINDYLRHPHCAYRNGNLCGVPIVLVSSSIEDFVPPEQYDLVVLVNVLEHCFDVPRVFDVILSCLMPNSVFVFAENLIKRGDIASVVSNQFDCGHPIRLPEDFVEEFLVKNFNPLYKKKFYGLYDQKHRVDLYFIGRRK